jgi:hypothetical protein
MAVIATDELPWTTSRCNRLLRPISSKLAKLRADFERLRSAGGETRAAGGATRRRMEDEGREKRLAYSGEVQTPIASHALEKSHSRLWWLE